MIIKIKDICSAVYSGGTPNKKHPEYYDGGEIPWLNTGEIAFNRICKTEKYISDIGFRSSSAKWVPANAVIVAMYGATAARTAITKIPLTTNQACCNLVVDEDKADYRYVYYYLCSQYTQLASLANGGAQQNLNAGQIKDYDIDLPDMATQRKVADLLTMLDDKIEVNNEINKNLEQQAMALFRAWFIDYSPFQGQIPSDWKKYKLGEFLPVITGKKNVNVSSDHGEYPFFSCSQDIAWTDEYSFEGNAILVAGNGDFNVKFYSGKFEAYQRTYVLIPYNPRFTAWLFYAVKHNLDLITVAARGSVIKFITKGNLEDFAFHAPVDLDNCAIIDHFTAINNQIAENRTENSKLAELRNALLPRLMSGELDVSDIDL